MKRIFCLCIVLTSFIIMGFNDKHVGRESGIRPENLDQTVDPGSDFYQYACGGWMKNNPLTGEYSRFGSFDKLAENNKEQLKMLISEIASASHPQGSISQKIGDLYNMVMDSAKLNAEGVKPVMADLTKIAQLPDKSQLPELLGEMQRYGISAFWVTYVDADPMESNVNLFQTYQGGLGMGEREYYLAKDERTLKIREKYKEHIEKMFGLFGFSPAESENAAKSVMKIENRLALSAYPKEKLRDPYANYHKMSIDSFSLNYPEFEWVSYFGSLGVNPCNLNISQPEAFTEALAIISEMPLEDIKFYLQWKVIDVAAHCVDDAVSAQNFDFYGKIMSGKENQPPRWKDAVSTVNSSLGEAVGQLYVARYFPPEAKERMLELVKNLQISLGERIDALKWMSRKTKKKAQEKLAAFHVKIGYPDKWRDYSSLEIINDSYWTNYKRVAAFVSDYDLSQADKPVNRERWYMSPQTVNAYYNPTTNEICFPAGILQYPFFDMNADDAFNYGAIGVVIGHEMTHGFDDQGRQFDKDGNLKEWWTKKDAENFRKRAAIMVNFFDSIRVASGVHANGNFTLGENIADYGGVQVSFHAFKNVIKKHPLPDKDGFTPEQRFFLAYATVWAGNIREEEILRRTKIDPHSLGRWRVNGILPQIDSWYKAFNITSKDSMYIAPEKRVSIW